MLKRLLAALFLIITLGAAPQGRAASLLGPAEQVAVVIQFGDGHYIVRNTAWASSMTGMGLLLAAGLSVVATPSGFVCRIGAEGCTPPAEVCPCVGANWGYWYWAESEWKYAPVGAAGRLAPLGGIDAWVFGWGKNSPPPLIEPVAVFDAERLAPGVPEVTLSAGELSVRAPYIGDASENASAAAQYRAVGGEWSAPPLALARQAGAFVGILAGELTPGDYEIRLSYTDPDGVNGSASWTSEATLTSESRLYLPILQRTAP